jgi:hypothetical protein
MEEGVLMKKWMVVLLIAIIGIPSCSYIGRQIAIEQHESRTSNAREVLMTMHNIGAQCKQDGGTREECRSLFYAAIEKVIDENPETKKVSLEALQLLEEAFLLGYDEEGKGI